MTGEVPPPAEGRPPRRLLRLLGLVAAGLAAVAAAGASVLWRSLPDVSELKEGEPATTAFIERYEARRRAAGRPARAKREWVPLEGIALPLQRAVVMSEDHSFFVHDGVDWRQVREAAKQDLEERRLARGASTLTMQLAKNLYLEPAKSPGRKLREVLIARRLENELGKRRILELYLNLIQWGEGVYGAEAASRHWFGKSAGELDESEAAWLAAMIPRPSAENPREPSEWLRARHALLVDRLGRWRVEGLDPP